ncbi:MAG: ATP-dependent RNA helicase RhlB [Cellvibrionaceae bacterium]
MLKKLFGGGKSTEAAKPSPASNSKAQAPKSEKGPKKASSKGGNQSRRRASHKRNKAEKPQQPWDVSQFQVPEAEGKTRFHDLGLPDELMHGIADLGFEYCSPIQAQSLPYTLNGQDMIGKAQTGTGKTAAFLVTIIDDLMNHPVEGERFAGEARALIVAPTRELVMQIADDAANLVKYTGLSVHTLVGGMDYDKQRRKLNDSYCDILVATPGRLLDFAQSRDVYLDQVEVLVLDEADRMLDMGFIPQVRKIVRYCPDSDHRQTLLFSATFPDEVSYLMERWTHDPQRIEIAPERVATDSVEQHVYYVAGDEKFDLLYNILKMDGVENLIVFANRRDECRVLNAKLEKLGFKVGLLSGEIAQNKRVATLDGFKTGKLNVLVATDVAGRGIHIDGISHVVNYNLPEEAEDYVHRIGRTGRAGKTGVSYSFACEDDAFRLPDIEKLLGDKLNSCQPPVELLDPAPHVEVPREVRRGKGGGNRGGSRGGAGGGRHGGGRGRGGPRR